MPFRVSFCLLWVSLLKNCFKNYTKSNLGYSATNSRCTQIKRGLAGFTYLLEYYGELSGTIEWYCSVGMIVWYCNLGTDYIVLKRYGHIKLMILSDTYVLHLTYFDTKKNDVFIVNITSQRVKYYDSQQKNIFHIAVK